MQVDKGGVIISDEPKAIISWKTLQNQPISPDVLLNDWEIIPKNLSKDKFSLYHYHASLGGTLFQQKTPKTVFYRIEKLGSMQRSEIQLKTPLSRHDQSNVCIYSVKKQFLACYKDLCPEYKHDNMGDHLWVYNGFRSKRYEIDKSSVLRLSLPQAPRVAILITKGLTQILSINSGHMWNIQEILIDLYNFSTGKILARQNSLWSIPRVTMHGY